MTQTLATPIAQAGALTFRADGRFLALVTGASWTLPKGHLDAGETPAQAAHRELEEETGVRAEISSLLFQFNFERRGRVYDLTLFLATYESGEAHYSDRPDTSAIWLDPIEARGMATPDSHYLRALDLAMRGFAPEGKVTSPLTRDDLGLLEQSVGHSLALERLSGPSSSRPLYLLAGHRETVRLLDSPGEALRAARTANLMGLLPEPSYRAAGRWLIAPFIEGRRLDRSPQPAARMALVGATLGRMHAAALPDAERAAARLDSIKYAETRFSRALESVRAMGLLIASECSAANDLFLHWLDEAVPATAIVPTHFDFVPENLLIGRQGMIPIDFESSRLFLDGYDQNKARSHFLAEPKAWAAFEDAYLLAAPPGSPASAPAGLRLFACVRTLANRARRPDLDHRPLQDCARELLA